MFDNFPFQIFAWMAAIVFAVESLMAKFISKHKIQNPWLFNLVWVGFVILFNTVICLWAGVGIPKYWGNIIWSGLFFSLSMTLFIFVVYRFDVSVFVPLENFRTIFGVVLGVLFLSEILTPSQLWLIGAMVIAGILVTLDEEFSIKSFFNKKILLVMAEMLALAFWAMFLKKAAAETDFWTLNFWYSAIGGLPLILTWPWFKKDIRTLNTGQVGSVFALAVAGAVSNLAAAKAYASNISISGAIISIPLSVVAVIVLSLFFPKLLEGHNWKVYGVRLIAAVVLVYAGIKLS